MYVIFLYPELGSYRGGSAHVNQGPIPCVAPMVYMDI